MYAEYTNDEGKVFRSSSRRSKVWLRHRQEYLEEAYAYLASYPFQHHSEYRQRLQEEIQGHMGLLFWIAYDIILDTEQTRDCVMDALKNACQSVQHYTAEQIEGLQVLPWIKTIVRNEAIDVSKKRRKQLESSLEQMIEERGIDDPLWYPISREKVAQQPEIVLLQQDACRRLAEVFALLPKRQAHAISAHFLYEQAHRNTADTFGISEKGANMLSSRGIKTLREAMGKAGLEFRDFYVGKFEGVLTQFIVKEEDFV